MKNLTQNTFQHIGDCGRPVITFKGKAVHNEFINNDWTRITSRAVKVPILTMRHCNHSRLVSVKTDKIGAYTNSDMLPAILGRLSKRLFPHGYVLLDQPLPNGVKIESDGFFVTIGIYLD